MTQEQFQSLLHTLEKRYKVLQQEEQCRVCGAELSMVAYEHGREKFACSSKEASSLGLAWGSEEDKVATNHYNASVVYKTSANYGDQDVVELIEFLKGVPPGGFPFTPLESPLKLQSTLVTAEQFKVPVGIQRVQSTTPETRPLSPENLSKLSEALRKT